MDVAAWLRELGLERHEQAFRDNDVDAKVLPHLTAEDLKDIGITSVGHRRTILAAIEALRQETPSPDLEAATPAPALTEPAATPPEAERRQLTVLFCDLVDSTALSARLDPEDMGAVIRTYQDRCAEVVRRWDGHVAKYMGDGVLVYFGYPQAHEDDAERAVRAGLELVDSVAKLDTLTGEDLAARVGIATGLVMVGDLIGEGASQERAVVGETPNLAARLQGLAEPGHLVIAPSTRSLLGGLFELADLGVHDVKGFTTPIRAWRVLAESAAESRFEAMHGQSLTPLVGREHEIALLLERFERARDGEGQVVLLSGEPGIGKSRVVRALRERLADRPHTPVSHFCSPYHTNSALHPVIGLLERAAGFARDDLPETKLDKLEQLLARSKSNAGEVAPLLAALLSIPVGERYAPLDLTPQRQKQRTLEVLVDQLAGLAARQPTLAVYEDVHWVDPSTVELLDLVIERAQRLPVLVLITFRPEFSPPWSGHGHVIQLSLSRLTRRHGEALVTRVTGGKVLPAEILDQIVAHADGVPLFVEELTKTMLESGLLKDASDRYELSGPLPSLAIPATLQDSLMARLDRLAPVKDVAQIGATIGRQFSHELLASVASLGDNQVTDALDQLVNSELVFRRGTPPNATYTFKHALVQDAAYQSLLKSRRQQLHARIAKILEERFEEIAETEPELLAHHYAAAGLAKQAVAYLQKAGERAAQRSANPEAIAHLSKGLEVLGSLPEGAERARRELDLLTTMGPALMAAKGYAAPEVEPTYRRALELCQELGDAPKHFSALHGLWFFLHVRGDLDAARSLAEQLVDMAKGRGDPGLDLAAHRALGYNLHFLGELEAARSHLDRVIESYDPAIHGGYAFRHGGADPGVGCLTYGALIVWALGHPDQAIGQNEDGLALAQKLAHPLSKAWALISAAIVHQLRREPEATLEHAEAAAAISAEQGFPVYAGWMGVLRGWALGEQEPSAEVIAEMRRGLDASRATGVGAWTPYWLALLASTHGRLGQPQEGLVAVTEALDQVARTSERHWEAELNRLQGQLLLAGNTANQPEAEACFHKAIEIARSQKAKSWELRAATSLARLWRDQGQRAAAQGLLAPVYEWFTEGFDTADLMDAKELLDDLR